MKMEWHKMDIEEKKVNWNGYRAQSKRDEAHGITFSPCLWTTV